MPDHGEVDASPGEVTALLDAWGHGDRDALDRLIPIVYAELRRLAHRELRGEARERTMGTTGLVHEAYLRLVGQNRTKLENRRHFLNVAAQVMRRVLVDGARKRGAVKRGAGAATLRLDDVPEPIGQPDGDLLALDEALARLEEFDPRLSRLVELRYFAGLTFEQVGEVLGTSTATAWRDWNAARAWLFDNIHTGGR
ncbi:MAG TPA: sigma-70 family RNA polymerase sigma factor [Thermoanaerobaculia bacterium]